MTRKMCVLALSVAFPAVLGCREPVGLSPVSPAPPAEAAGVKAAFDCSRDGSADFFTFADAEGRVRYIGYDTTADGAPDVKVDLDAIPVDRSRHLVIILDGVSYDLIREFYDSGGLRMFHPPSRVVVPYPTMTDICMADLLGAKPAEAMEARYYDRSAGKVVGGSWDYLTGEGKTYNRLLQYRMRVLWDPIGYVYPRRMFGKEMKDLKEVFDARESREVISYFATSAGMGTRLGADGHRECLEAVERLVNQILCETRGLTKVTLLADHGHSYTPATQISLDDFLTERGWRITDRLTRPRDVSYIRFGLETYAGFYTRSSEDLAADLVEAEGVTLASFASDEQVVVLAPDGQRAMVRHDDGRYRYEPISGDPLKLNDLLERMDTEDGFHDADLLLEAMIDHYYPAPLQRLWRTHFGLVENPPDVIISLAADRFSGSDFMAAAVDIASTHGSLRRLNSVTFIMSTAGTLPEIMRAADVPKHMSDLMGEPWPTGK